MDSNHTFSLTVNIPSTWLFLVMYDSDIFGRSYCGYWARGVARDPDLGWLVWEDDEQHRRGEEPHGEVAEAAWRDPNAPLPRGWFRFNEAFAIRAFEEGVKRWGVNWLDEADANKYDIAIQLAAFGEIKYG